jgi:sulfate permease, SulP family
MSDEQRDNPQQFLNPAQLLSSIIAGSVAGVLSVTFMFSYSAVIFTGDLASYVPRATGQMLFSAVVISIIVALFSQFRGIVALPQDNPTAVLAVMIAALSQTLGGSAGPEALFAQATVVMILSTAVAGLLFFVMGRLHLASLVQFIPYPVIAGFLAGTGWLLFKGSFSVMAGVAFDFADLPALVGLAKLWLPGAAFAFIVFFTSQRYSHFLVMPGLIIGAICLFHLILFVSGTDLPSAVMQGWLIEPFGGGGLWQPVDLNMLTRIDWLPIFGEVAGISTILVIAVISVLLNLTALEFAFGREIDINREMQTTGIANLLAAPAGGLIGYHYVSLSTLGRRLKGDSRLVGIVVAVFCFLAMTVGADVLGYIPLLVLGGLVMFVGLGLLNDWLVQSWRKLSRSDIAIILAILLVIETIGFLEGVVVGIAIAAGLFIMTYRRVSVIQHALSGKEFHSNLERPPAHRAFLLGEGDRVLFLKLHGFIFFATTIGLIQKIDEALARSQSQLSFIILDIQHVTGIDTSALHGFARIKQKALEKGVQIALTHVSPEIARQFHAEEFIDGNAIIDSIFDDADHALEWCEDFMLREGGYLPDLVGYSFDDQLAAMFTTEAERNSFKSYLEIVGFAIGDYLFHAHEHKKRIFLIESGELSIFVDETYDQRYRLRKVGPGSLLGIADFFRQSKADALVSAQADTDGRAFVLGADDFDQMKRQDPEVAMAFQTFVLGFLSDRFATNLRMLQGIRKGER